MKRRPKRYRPKGSGSVYRKGGRWCGQATLGGRRVTVYGDSEEEVKAKLGLASEAKVSPSVTVGEYAEGWLEAARKRVAASTAVRYARDLGYVLKHLGEVKLVELTTAQVNRALIQVSDAVSPDAARKGGLRLRQVLRSAERAGDIPRNPAAAASIPRPSHSLDPVALTPEEVARFLEAARDDRLYVFYLTAIDTGARLRELMALTWGDWNPRRRTLAFNKALKQDKAPWFLDTLKTKAGRRTVKVSEGTAAAIEAARPPKCRPGDILFPNRKGGYLNASNIYDRSFRQILRKAGLPEKTRFHDLRHTSATLLLMAGVDVRTVAARLGHSSPAITLCYYGHVLPAMEERAAGEMGKILGLGVDS